MAEDVVNKTPSRKPIFSEVISEMHQTFTKKNIGGSIDDYSSSWTESDSFRTSASVLTTFSTNSAPEFRPQTRRPQKHKPRYELTPSMAPLSAAIIQHALINLRTVSHPEDFPAVTSRSRLMSPVPSQVPTPRTPRSVKTDPVPSSPWTPKNISTDLELSSRTPLSVKTDPVPSSQWTRKSVKTDQVPSTWTPQSATTDQEPSSRTPLSVKTDPVPSSLRTPHPVTSPRTGTDSTDLATSSPCTSVITDPVPSWTPKSITTDQVTSPRTLDTDSKDQVHSPRTPQSFTTDHIPSPRTPQSVSTDPGPSPRFFIGSSTNSVTSDESEILNSNMDVLRSIRRSRELTRSVAAYLRSVGVGVDPPPEQDYPPTPETHFEFQPTPEKEDAPSIHQAVEPEPTPEEKAAPQSPDITIPRFASLSSGGRPRAPTILEQILEAKKNLKPVRRNEDLLNEVHSESKGDKSKKKSRRCRLLCCFRSPQVDE